MNGRPSSFGNTQSNAQPAPRQVAAPGAAQDLTEKFEQLRSRRERLQQVRMRHELKYEQAQAEEAQCRQRAQEMGASSIEDLERMISQAEEKSRQELADFEAELEREQALLEEIDRKLAQAAG